MAAWRKYHIPMMVIWCAGVTAGFWFLLKYEMTPGKAAAAEMTWPASSVIARADSQATLVMFAHPECPCSRASLAELREILTRYPDRLKCYVLFITQPAAGQGAEECRKSELWKNASAISGVTCVVDETHAAMEAFHAETSGQVLLYDRAGNLRFNGGITAARDHEGENAGVDAITEFLKSGAARPATTPVFGCSLR